MTCSVIHRPTHARPRGRPARPRAARRRGSIYAVVLGMALLVSLIGLSAVAVGRVNLKVAAVGGDGADAELLALSAVEHAAATINSDPAWRTRYSNDVETSPVNLGRGTFTWKLVDEADGSLSTGGLQPVRVKGIGRVGEAARCYSVQLNPGGTNLLTNAGAEQGVAGYEVQGADCTLQVATDEPRNGARYLLVTSRLSAAAGPQQNLTGRITSGTSYYVELWAKPATAAEELWLGLVLKKSGQSDTVFKVRTQQAKSAEWTRVSGTLTPTWGTTPDSVYLRIESSAMAQDLKLDDLKVVESTGTPPMLPASDTWRQEQLP